ncbi:RBBP9/YdeN family alpha/beta hydrolase [Ancylobacter vacuolatus]|uniref:Alpha/beta hydrolase family esterase n=1 Tax=Ancylobacter vacuolatus TaxID=223389 RepID=A0ABU0DIL9_9HYPH|nr:alpha/beta hydrolase [Ancylobacter vacuolatus]MDQ0348176.1 putative alpha/beta hydrolase family esterase [Ancylobacter vacuolatus]
MAVDFSSFDFLVIPGRENAPAEHWQSHWLGAFPNSSRLIQSDWSRPEVGAWTARLDAAVVSSPRRVVLVAHSVGVATVLRWTAAQPERARAKVAAAFLAAPTNVDDPDPSFDLVRNFGPMPLSPLPHPALVLASRDDPRVTPAQASAFAQAWGADLADVGELGHIGSAARLGLWPAGLVLLGGLMARL